MVDFPVLCRYTLRWIIFGLLIHSIWSFIIPTHYIDSWSHHFMIRRIQGFFFIPIVKTKVCFADPIFCRTVFKTLCFLTGFQIYCMHQILLYKYPSDEHNLPLKPNFNSVDKIWHQFNNQRINSTLLKNIFMQNCFSNTFVLKPWFFIRV